jgi:hypothetical protein
MKELSPMGSLLAGPFTVLLMLLLLGPCVINLLTRFMVNSIKLQ